MQHLECRHVFAASLVRLTDLSDHQPFGTTAERIGTDLATVQFNEHLRQSRSVRPAVDQWRAVPPVDEYRRFKKEDEHSIEDRAPRSRLPPRMVLYDDSSTESFDIDRITHIDDMVWRQLTHESARTRSLK